MCNEQRNEDNLRARKMRPAGVYVCVCVVLDWKVSLHFMTFKIALAQASAMGARRR
jgi:hypothetical protein